MLDSRYKFVNFRVGTHPSSSMRWSLVRPALVSFLRPFSRISRSASEICPGITLKYRNHHLCHVFSSSSLLLILLLLCYRYIKSMRLEYEPIQPATARLKCAPQSDPNRLNSRHVQRFRGGLVFKAHRLLYHPTLDSKVIKKQKTIRFKQIQFGSPSCVLSQRRNLLSGPRHSFTK